MNAGLIFAVLWRRPTSDTLQWTDVVPVMASYWPFGLGVTAAATLTGLLSPTAKARLVFWRWRNPLPGSEAFTRYALEDARIDTKRLGERFGTIPRGAAEQNRTWYRMYRDYADNPSVADANREFLFFRDYAALVVLLAAACVAMVVPAGAGWRDLAYCVFALSGQYALASRAARVHARRLVANVLALASTA